MVSHVFPCPPLGGHELRVLKLMEWLRSRGYEVVFVLSTEFETNCNMDELRKFAHRIYSITPPWWTRLGRKLPRTRRIIWERVKPLIAPFWASISDAGEPGSYPEILSDRGNLESKKGISSSRLAALVSRLANSYQPVAVIAEYIFLTDCFALLKPEVLKIIDTIDVFSLKLNQVVSYGIDEPWSCTREEERAYLLRGDVIVAIQDREAEMLRQLVPERDVITVGIDYGVAEPFRPDGIPPNVITIVGSDNPKNVHGLRSFLSDCWPQIKSAYPSALLNIVGRVGALCKVDDSAVNYFPAVNNLTEIYKLSRVIINPCVAGTGLKIKSVEALAHARPLVAWPRGVEGLGYDGAPPYLKCESWKEFAAAVVRVLQSDSEALALSQRAGAYARSRFDRRKVYAALRACLEKPRIAENGPTVDVEPLASPSSAYSTDTGPIASV